MEVFWVMLSLDVFRFAWDIDKTNASTTKLSVWDVGKRNVFEAVASGGAGELLFAMDVAHKQSEVSMSSMVGFVTDLGNKVCGDLRARFWSDNFGGCFISKCAHSW